MVRQIAAVQPPQVPHGTQVVRIVVGADNQEYAVHKNLICASSEFFNRMFNGNFTEAKEGALELPEESPVVFNLFYDWLYTGRVAKGLSAYYEKKEESCFVDDFWIKAYLMADRLLIDKLRELAIVSLKNLFSRRLPLVPSKVFIAALFGHDSLPDMKIYVAEHVAYWLLRCHEKKVWEACVDAHEKFGTEMARAIIRCVEDFSHPSKRQPAEDKEHQEPSAGKVEQRLLRGKHLSE